MVTKLLVAFEELANNKDLLATRYTMSETCLVIPQDLFKSRRYPRDEYSVEDLEGNRKKSYTSVVRAHRKISRFGNYSDNSFLPSIRKLLLFPYLLIEVFQLVQE